MADVDLLEAKLKELEALELKIRDPYILQDLSKKLTEWRKKVADFKKQRETEKVRENTLKAERARLGLLQGQTNPRASSSVQSAQQKDYSRLDGKAAASIGEVQGALAGIDVEAGKKLKELDAIVAHFASL